MHLTQQSHRGIIKHVHHLMFLETQWMATLALSDNNNVAKIKYKGLEIPNPAHRFCFHVWPSEWNYDGGLCHFYPVHILPAVWAAIWSQTWLEAILSRMPDNKPAIWHILIAMGVSSQGSWAKCNCHQVPQLWGVAHFSFIYKRESVELWEMSKPRSRLSRL